jgi:murein DD-endopeptidase
MYRKPLLFRERGMSSSQFKVSQRVLSVCLLILLAAGCGHEPVRRVPDSPAPAPVQTRTKHLSPGQKAAVAATHQLGVPYRYGGSTTRGFDCSGLVQYAWSRAGVRIPRTTTEQWRKMSPVRRSDLEVGDLLFFRIDGRISHVGLYLGQGRFVHAPATGRSVSVASLNAGFYRQTFAGATRP